MEDKFNFILHCKAYETERNNFFQQLEIERPHTDVIVAKDLFDTYPRKFAKYINKLLNLRKLKLT